MKLYNRMTRRGRGQGRDRKRAVDLRFEQFEERFLLATVLTTVDNGNNVTPTANSLRAAILSGDNTIDFNIPTIDTGFHAATGTWTISLGTVLPTIDHQVVIDGASQPGFTQSPVIELDGGGNAFDGLILGAGSAGSTIRALNIAQFGGAGIVLQSNGNTIVANFLGLDVSNTIASPGNVVGVVIAGTSGNTIGGTVSGTANVIGLNTSAGVSIVGGTATANLVAGNFIGTDANSLDLGNLTGIAITAPQNIVGGSVAAAANVIGHNTAAGVSITGAAATANLVAGNLIGTNSVRADLGNGVGIIIGSAGNTIGGTVAGSAAANVIGFSSVIGLSITGAAATDNVVAGNFIGTDANGLNLANAAGIGITGPQNTIGGTVAAAANIIGPSAGAGVSITGAAATANLVAGNFIGTNANGLDLSNSAGVVITSAQNTVGGTVAAAANVIGPSGGAGVSITGAGATGNLVAGNFIGTNTNGLNLGNTAGVVIGSAQNTVGGTVAAAANVIGANSGAGVSITGAAATANLVAGNFIGTNTNGLNLGNGLGVVINQASGNTIGGTATGTPNTIAFNTGDATHGAVTVDTGTGNAIRQNLIFGNGTTPASSGILLANNGNNNGNNTNAQHAPQIVGATSVPGLTTVQVSLANFTAGTYDLDFYASAPGDATGSQVQAHVFLGTRSIATGTSGIVTFTTTLSNGQQVTATATSLAAAANPNDTSQFATAIDLSDAFTVTTNANDGIGSLRRAILNANQNPDFNTIDFAITNNQFVISPATSLPPITNPVLLDGTSQSGYVGAPIIRIDGATAGLTGDGLLLTSTSTGSRIRGLNIFGFASGAGIHLQTGGNVIQSNYLGTNLAGTAAGPGNLQGVRIDGTSNNTIGGLAAVGNLISGNSVGVSIENASAQNNLVAGNFIGTNAAGTAGVPNTSDGVRITAALNNTIGGTVAGLGNVIAFNQGNAIVINTGTGNAIHRNSIFQNTAGAIVLQSGGNADQLAPSNVTVNSSGGTTSVTGTVTGGPVGTYTVEIFSSAAAGPSGVGQAAVFLGSTTATVAVVGGTGSFTATGLPALLAGQTVVVTATSPVDNSSALSAPATVVNPFQVITTADNVTGSLRQAIANANSDPGSSPVTIAFAIPASGPGYDSAAGTWTIQLTAALQALTHPVILDATTQPGFAGSPVIILDGNGLSGNGLTLNTGSAGSTVKGLNIIRFTGSGAAGIAVASDGNILQSNYIGVASDGQTPQPNAQGVLISASNNTVGGTALGAGNVIAQNTAAAVNVATGTGNAIRQNSIFANGSAIVLAAGANNDQSPPSLTGATSNVGTTTVQGSLSHLNGFQPTTSYDIDFFASVPGDPSGAQAHTFLGTRSITTDATGDAAINVSLSVSVPFGQTITATATLTSSPPPAGHAFGDSSTLAAPTTVANPFVVTTTQDNGDNTNPTLGSLRQVIQSVNVAPPGTNSITFNITPGVAPFVIDVGATPLPAITKPVTVDGTSQPGFTAGIPVIMITTTGLANDGLTLGLGSSGSIIKGLNIVRFARAGIHIQSNNNLIIGDVLGTDRTGTAAGPGNLVGIWIDNTTGNSVGGTTATLANLIGFNTSAGVSISGSAATANLIEGNSIGTNAAGTASLGNGAGVIINSTASNNTIGGSVTGAGNLIANNTGFAVHIFSGSGNAIRQNRIFGNTGNIKLESGANDNQAAPTNLAFTSVDNLTTIQGQITGGPAGTYTVEFFASNTAGTSQPAFQFLGSWPVTLSVAGGSQSFTATFPIPTALASTQTLTATVTRTNNSTSEFPASSATFTDPFAVITGTDGVIGSLRQAILNANVNADASSISFAGLPSPYLITLTSALPVITAPVTLDGTTLTNFNATDPSLPLAIPQINAGGVGGDGISLGTNSDSSRIEGLSIVGFLSGAGIRVQSLNNQILGNYIGVALTQAATPPPDSPIQMVPAPNALGVYVVGSSNTIGGTADGQANVIANNIGAGVTIDTGNANRISGNSIFGNGQGIVLANGGNQNLPAPILGGATFFAGTTTIQGLLAGTGILPNTTYVVEFFESEVGDPSGEGQAHVFLGSTSVTTDASGLGAITFTSPIAPVVVGQRITATTTSTTTSVTPPQQANNTSPFAFSVTVSAAFVVSTQYDVDGAGNPLPGSLRQAIINANRLPDLSVIAFDIREVSLPIIITLGSTPSPSVSLPPQALPTIIAPVIIDGTTQFGFDVTLTPIIEIDGANGLFDGLILGAGSQGSTITALAVANFRGAGIRIETSGNTIVGNFIGTDTTGNHPGPGNTVGILIDGLAPNAASTNMIGGTSILSANVIGFNTAAGISITGVGATGNQVLGNFIGVDRNQSNQRLNNHVGIVIDGTASNNTIGGLNRVDSNTVGGTVSSTTTSAANVIGFNSVAGVSITGASTSGNVVAGNFIGTDAFDNNRANGVGVLIDGSAVGNTIGGTNSTIGGTSTSVTTAGNVIGFNSSGISIGGAGSAATGNVIRGNWIGVDPVNPKIPIGNTTGISILTSNNTVGGTLGGPDASVANVIGYNSAVGVSIDGDDNQLLGNYIGTDEDGNRLSNPIGAVISGSSNLIGGPNLTTTAAGTTLSTISGNVVGFNTTAGVSLVGASNTLEGNFLGTDLLGRVLGNLTGLMITGDSNTVGSTNNTSNTVGATISSTISGNVIAANSGDGIWIRTAAQSGPKNNVILGNSIGGITSPTGDVLAPPNLLNGIRITGGLNNTVGGGLGSASSLGADANTITGNGGDGILINLGRVDLATTIQGNLVSYNTQNGIHFIGDLTAGVLQVQMVRNFVGTTVDGKSTYDSRSISQGNGLDGIRLEQSATGNSGGIDSNPAAALLSGNVSSGNGLSGINIQTYPLPGGTSGIPYARVSIVNNKLGADIDGTLTSVSRNGVNLPFGNALDGILLNKVLGVTIGGTSNAAFDQANVISGNLGRGLEIRGGSFNDPVDKSENLIQSNMIGTDITGQQVVDQNGANLGNLSDGIFLLNPGMTDITHNVISNNRGAGIHAQSDQTSTIGAMTIEGNLIGTNIDGKLMKVGTNDFGNSSDGVFFDGIKNTAATATAIATIHNNVISGNHANGINLLNSSQIAVTSNKLGTNIDGTSIYGDPNSDFGNAGNGIFLNQSSHITIGGSALSAGNVISSNHASGIFVSGNNPDPTPGSTNKGATADGNLIAGNIIGLNQAGTVAVPNAVVGIVLSNANWNTVGLPGAANAISGNLLNGILLANVAQNNLIQSNLIGTDATGSSAVGNSAAGLFFLGGNSVGATIPGLDANSGVISSNKITGNVISGNSQDGIQIFGTGSTGNTVSNNWIGLGQQGQPIPNLGNGVFLNDAGGRNTNARANTIGGANGAANTIAGNNQSGVLLLSVSRTTGGNVVAGNLIGTDLAGNRNPNLFNGANGVQIYGSSNNTIGGTTGIPGTGLGNVISGNAQSGVLIFTPATSAPANNNIVIGNEIGTNPAGTSRIDNGGDGIQIINSSNNTIGGTTPDRRNVISGNAANGISIFQVAGSGLVASKNVIAGNSIGTNPTGSAAIPNLGNGVLITDGTDNLIGGTVLASGAGLVGGTMVPTALGGSGNLISGNSQWGIQIGLTGSSTGANMVQGNFIGTDSRGAVAIGNQFGGVLINDLNTQTPNPVTQLIGGSTPGAGNLISGNSGIGIELLGPQSTNVVGTNNVVQGNLIGLNAGGAVLGNGTGIFVNNSPNNLIGGATAQPGTGPGNVISGNSQSGIQFFGTLANGNVIQGNAIGTNATGSAFPGGSSEDFPAQSVGVLIDGGSSNLVGGSTPGAANVLSGNIVGVQISGLKQNNGQFVGVGNTVQGNLIGTDTSGTVPIPNLDIGVFINNARGNLIGPGNLISANGIAGVEILGDGSKDNLIVGNVIGTGIDGRLFLPSRGQGKELRSSGPQPGVPVYRNAQLNGVVIIGASNNTIGLQTNVSGSQANVIRGNVEVGVYITNRDFAGRGYSTPVNNAVTGNTIQNHGLYGILLYNSPNNRVRPFTSLNRHLVKNKFGGNKINFRNFVSGFESGTRLRNKGTQPKAKAQVRSRVDHATPHRAAARIVAHPAAAGVHPRGPVHLLGAANAGASAHHHGRPGK